MRWTWWMVLGALWIGIAADAKPAPAPPCPGVRFLTGTALLPDAPGFDALVVDAQGQVAISTGCDPVAARLRQLKTGVRLRVRWKNCVGLANVRLTATVDANGCATASGTLRARRTKPTPFTAAPSTCGDGKVDAATGEQCDAGHDCSVGGPCAACSCGLATTTTLPGLFEQPNPWTLDVSGLTKSAKSDAIIQTLNDAGGWGGPNAKLQIDFSFHLLRATASDPRRTFVASQGYTTPDCDAPFSFPMPIGGAIEGQPGYACDVGNDDCHFLIVDPPTKRLIELYLATKSGTTLRTGCGIAWDLTRAYPDNLRGDQCTSADAGGFPIGAMLFTADEVAAGEIPHAIRFILPNERIKQGDTPQSAPPHGVYVHPATHAGAPQGIGEFPPYGVRFRLRADYPLATLPSDGARVIARAMQKYGMLLADGGNIALTAATDTYTTHKWDDPDVAVDSHSLFDLAVTDFEVVGLGPEIVNTYDCVPNP